MPGGRAPGLSPPPPHPAKSGADPGRCCSASLAPQPEIGATERNRQSCGAPDSPRQCCVGGRLAFRQFEVIEHLVRPPSCSLDPAGEANLTWMAKRLKPQPCFTDNR